jgi:hypothetical protein
MTVRRLLPILAVSALAACGSTSSSSGGAPGSPGRPGGPTLPGGFQTPKPVVVTGDISLTAPKAVTAHFTYTLRDAASCQLFAKYGDRNPSPGDTPDPNPVLSVPVPDRPVTFSDGQQGLIDPGAVEPYHGPNTYNVTGSALTGNGSVWLAPFGNENEPGGAPDGATLTITVHDDGSGDASFSGYIDPGSNTYTGKVTWSCSQ